MWRALFGTAPFAGDSVDELVDSTAAGVVTPPPLAADGAGAP